MSPTTGAQAQMLISSLLVYVIYRVGGTQYSGGSLRGVVLVEWFVQRRRGQVEHGPGRRTYDVSPTNKRYVEYIRESL
jgi:hypothetical protein